MIGAPLPEHEAMRLEALAPEKSHDPHVQQARVAAEKLYRLVAKTQSVGAIAGAMVEFARDWIESERRFIEQEARAKAKGEAAELLRAIDATRERVERIARGV